MMLDNSTYNKVKMLHLLSEMNWFIEKHGIIDAQVSGDQACADMMLAIQRDAQKHIEKLQRAMCMITQ